MPLYQLLRQYYLVFFAVASSALNLPIILDSPASKPPLSFNFSGPSSNFTDVNAVNFYCDPDLGSFEDKSSCVDAVSQMPSGNKILSFGTRDDFGPFDVLLPQIYASSGSDLRPGLAKLGFTNIKSI